MREINPVPNKDTTNAWFDSLTNGLLDALTRETETFKREIKTVIDAKDQLGKENMKQLQKVLDATPADIETFEKAFILKFISLMSNFKNSIEEIKKNEKSIT